MKTTTSNILTSLEATISEMKPYAEAAAKLGLDINQPQATGRLQQIADRAREFCRAVERRTLIEG